LLLRARQFDPSFSPSLDYTSDFLSSSSSTTSTETTVMALTVSSPPPAIRIVPGPNGVPEYVLPKGARVPGEKVGPGGVITLPSGALPGAAQNHAPSAKPVPVKKIVSANGKIEYVLPAGYAAGAQPAAAGGQPAATSHHPPPAHQTAPSHSQGTPPHVATPIVNGKPPQAAVEQNTAPTMHWHTVPGPNGTPVRVAITPANGAAPTTTGAAPSSRAPLVGPQPNTAYWSTTTTSTDISTDHTWEKAPPLVRAAPRPACLFFSCL
jgi:hypothetical protein